MFITLKGRVNERGQLEVEVPADLPPGEVRIFLETVDPEAERIDEARWDDSFAKSQDVLERMADKALRDDDAGLTDEIDPRNWYYYAVGGDSRVDIPFRVSSL